MKLLLLFEIAGLLLFGSLFAPSLMYVAEGNPLPEIEKPENKITYTEVATIDFEGVPVKLYYNSLQGFSYSDPNSQWERQSTPVCNADKSKCLYADFYHQFELKQNGEILSPDQIIKFTKEDINADIYIYVLDTTPEILQKNIYKTQDISRYCHEPDFCRLMKTVMPEDIFELSKNWKEMSDIDKNRYIRNMDTILYIEHNWHVFDPETGGSSYSDSDVRISWFRTDQGINYISLNNSTGGYNYYQLTDVQFDELRLVIGK